VRGQSHPKRGRILESPQKPGAVRVPGAAVSHRQQVVDAGAVMGYVTSPGLWLTQSKRGRGELLRDTLCPVRHDGPALGRFSQFRQIVLGRHDDDKTTLGAQHADQFGHRPPTEDGQREVDGSVGQGQTTVGVGDDPRCLG